jgi:3-dehydroquinate synthase
MDPRVLETLPEGEFRQGMAEVIKTAMIGDEALWDYLESHGEAIRRREPQAMLRVISACCRLKARVVESDEREAGYRRVLNLGHTVGHALERVSGYGMPHGDAVAIGMVAAGRLAVGLGRLPPVDLDRLVRLCVEWDLPTRMPRAFDPDEVMEALEADKKRIGKKLHFVHPVKIGRVEVDDALDRAELRRTLEELRSA